MAEETQTAEDNGAKENTEAVETNGATAAQPEGMAALGALSATLQRRLKTPHQLNQKLTGRADPMQPAGVKMLLPVFDQRGTGQISINGRDITTYFARPVLQMVLQQPFETAEREGEFDVVATVVGGGLSGQAGAVRHGISRALTNFEPGLRPALKAGGFMTRDQRVVERKNTARPKPDEVSSFQSDKIVTISCIKAAFLPLFTFRLMKQRQFLNQAHSHF